jgi:hypothetical protein
LHLRSTEISRLIQLLHGLQKDHEQHFHISSNYAGSSGLGNITIAVAVGSELDNMSLSGFAMAPGAEIAEPGSTNASQPTAYGGG